MFRLLLATASLLLIVSVHGQNFAYVTNQYGVTAQGGSPLHGCGVSCYDYSGDGLDDLTFGSEGNGIYLYFNTGAGFELDTILPEPGQTTAVIWADYDNDGDKDLFTGVLEGESHLWEQNDGFFEDVAEDRGIPQDANAMTYGASWHDYDLDGDLDLYICNYNWGDGLGNWFLRNDEGSFTSLDMGNDLTNADYPTFMVTFADFNNDGYPDVHVINDKLPPNELFVNNQDGTFSEISETAGIDVVTDAMSNSICDFDNDGDLDIYVAADNTGNYLYRNDGNFVFTEIAESIDLRVERFCWAAQWIDFNNTGYQDLFVSTNTPVDNNLNPLFRAFNGEGTYTLLGSAFDFPNTTASYSNAKGDWNQDGALDLVQFVESPMSMGVWQNNGNNNNWVGLKLISTASNPDAVGVWVTCNTPNSFYKDYTLSGEGYMGQNSDLVHFGLGSEEEISFLKVEWPSGWTDILGNPSPNTYIQLIEGSTYQVPINYEGDLYLCEGDSIVLDAGDYEVVSWSNGTEGRYCTLYEVGTVQATVLTSYGFEATSSPITVDWAPESAVAFTSTHPLCHNASDGQILCVAPEGSTLLINGEVTDPLVESLPSGEYLYEIIDPYGCHYQHEVTLVNPPALEMQINAESPLCNGSADGWIEVLAEGGSGEITQLPSNSELDEVSAGEYWIELIDANGCSLLESYVLTAPDPIEVEFNIDDANENESGSCEAIIAGGTAPYDLIWSSGLEGNPQTELNQGNYVLTVIDEHGCISTWPFSIDMITGLHEWNAAAIHVYPNPFTDQIFIEGADAYRYEIFDMQGRLILHGKNQKTQLELGELSNGSYLLHLINQQGERIHTVKILKE